MARLGRGALVAALVASWIAAAGCSGGGGRAELEVEYTFLDSMAVLLQNLRAMDQEIGQVVMADTVSSTDVVPLISERFRPVVVGLVQRAASLETTAKVAPVQETFLQYLDLRLEAYDAAIAGLRDDRPELYDVFSRKQAEADRLGRGLEQEIREVRARVPGYQR